MTGCKKQRSFALMALSEQSKGNNCGHLQRQCIEIAGTLSAVNMSQEPPRSACHSIPFLGARVLVLGERHHDAKGNRVSSGMNLRTSVWDQILPLI